MSEPKVFAPARLPWLIAGKEEVTNADDSFLGEIERHEIGQPLRLIVTIEHEHGGPPVDQPGFEAPLVGERVAMEGAGLTYWSDTPSKNFDLLRGRIEQSPAS